MKWIITPCAWLSTLPLNVLGETVEMSGAIWKPVARLAFSHGVDANGSDHGASIRWPLAPQAGTYSVGGCLLVCGVIPPS
jgi:hypothetical protein